MTRNLASRNHMVQTWPYLLCTQLLQDININLNLLLDIQLLPIIQLPFTVQLLPAIQLPLDINLLSTVHLLLPTINLRPPYSSCTLFHVTLEEWDAPSRWS